MKTNNWREEIRKLIYIRPESLNDAEILYLEAENIIQSLLDKQKEEIIKVIENSDTDNYKQDDGIIRYFVANKFDIINKIKEI